MPDQRRFPPRAAPHLSFKKSTNTRSFNGICVRPGM
jgi:hypothetical protein